VGLDEKEERSRMSPNSQETRLKAKVQEALKGALKRQQRVEVSALRLLLAEIKNDEIAQQKPADDNRVLDVIAREVRRRRESIEAFEKGNRADLVAQEEAGLAVLMNYLPQQLSREEVVAAARQAMDTVGATGPSDKGRVMSHLMPQLKGKADGKVISEVVSELLAGR